MEKYLKSSANPEKISLTIKGIGVAIIPVLIFLGGVFGINLVEIDLVQLLNSIATMVSAIMVVYGLGRKVFYKAIQ